jgi:hypothetical protein
MSLKINEVPGQKQASNIKTKDVMMHYVVRAFAHLRQW